MFAIWLFGCFGLFRPGWDGIRAMGGNAKEMDIPCQDHPRRGHCYEAPVPGRALVDMLLEVNVAF